MTLDFSSAELQPRKRKSKGFILSIGAVVGTILLGSTLAASINLNDGGPVEFGQGITQTTACDSQVEVTPISTFVNSDGGGDFKFSAITLSDLDGTNQADASDEGCAGKSFTIKTYDSDGNLLTPNYSISLDGAGNFASSDGTADGTSEGNAESLVTLVFVGALIDAEAVYRITIESGISVSSNDEANPVVVVGSGTLSNSSITTFGGSISITYRVTDDIGCCGYHQAWMYYPNGTVVQQVSPTLVSGSATDATFSASFSVPSGVIPGDYEIKVQALDLAGKDTHLQLIGTVAISSPDIGDEGPGGGTIFYISESGFNCGANFSTTGSPTGGKCHYLEAAHNNEFLEPWSGNTVSWIGTTLPDIGSGLLNTLAMVEQNETPSRAGTLALDYVSPNGTSDWYLPSKDELHQLFLIRASVPNVAMLSQYYWSSTEFDSWNVWIEHFYYPEQKIDWKDSRCFSKFIRAF